MARPMHELLKIERTAKSLRGYVRKKAKLPLAWHSASENMRNWYRDRAEQMLLNEGEIEKCE